MYVRTSSPPARSKTSLKPAIGTRLRLTRFTARSRAIQRRSTLVSLTRMPDLNALGIVVSDMARSIRFYRLLGLDVPETPDEGHVDASLPNGLRLMLDSEEVILSFRPDWTRETGNQI